ncbi:threonylcarbamoyl-AMP synthase [candidate division KSB1 bacterium]|nr:threonylcarbamoyl-AMP synthase [candidate division KSB1 bacterium]
MSKKIKIDPQNPQSDRIRKAAEILQAGGIIGYPTETVYGIGCSVFDSEAVNKIYKLKNRDKSKALIVIAADLIQISDLVETIPESAERLMESFWPGPLTIVFKVSSRLKEFAFRKSKTIAIRIPDSPICLTLLKVCGFPLVSTSANRSSEPDSTTAEQVEKIFGNELDAIIDGGPTPCTKPSTVIDITKNPARIVRVGAFSILELNTVLDTIV